ncbi:MAG: NADAR family protein [bacterium]
MARSKIDTFRGEYFFLSNFYPVPVTYDGLTYQNNEAAFQAQKIFNPEEKKTFTELAPKDAKRRGRQVRLRPDWEKVRNGIMEEIVRAKFLQHEDLKEKLLSTGDALLIEGNTWNDRYWGVDKRSRTGKNYLGQILMKVRRELQEGSSGN